jgi:hypothetical protein
VHGLRALTHPSAEILAQFAWHIMCNTTRAIEFSEQEEET